MEAMASGIPTITTDIPENRILVENNINGLLIPVQNSSSLAKKIQQLMENPEMRETITNNAKQTIQNSFPLEKIVKKWENILMETIK